MSRRARFLVVVAAVLCVCGSAWGQKANSPNPADGATDVIQPLLRWTAGSTAVFHDVYFGTTPELGPDQLVAPKQAVALYWHPFGIEPGTTYYWRVDEMEADGVTIHTGDVWSFLAQPLTAFMPDPADGSNEALLAPNLTWLAGQTAQKHHVYFSADKAAVTDGAAEADRGLMSEPNFAPGELQPVTTYYWRIDEVLPGDVERAGLLWSFTTILAIDDFESYTDDEGSRIYESWIDGWVNNTGSTVGYVEAPFAEQKIVHSGAQSMPLDYDNVSAPHYSEAELDFGASQNWAAGGADTLTLFIKGQAADFEIPFVDAPPVIDGEVDDIWSMASVHKMETTINGDPPTGSVDFSGQFRVLYDAENLYALVDVNDDILMNDSPNNWRDDSVELYIDGDNSKGPAPLSGLARQHTFGWTTAEMQGTNNNPAGVAHGQVDTPTGWRVEIKLPWQSLISSDAPAGQLIGIDCFYNDDDDGGDTRESQVAWRSTVGDDWRTPASWGTAVLVAPGAAGADPVYVAIEDSANRTGVIVHPDPELAKSLDWVKWQIPLSDFADAGVKLNAVRRMYIGLGDRANPTAGSAGVLYIDDIFLTKPAPTE